MLTATEQARLAREQQKIIKSGRVTRQFLRSVCVDCIYDPKEKGSPKAQIAACTCEACPLYPIRHLWSGDAGIGGSVELVA